MTHTNTSGAEDAAVVVDDETLMRCVDGHARMTIGNGYVVNAELESEGLEIAVSVCNADGADVIALREEHLKDHLAIGLEPVGVDHDLHAFLNASDASGK